MKIVLAPDKFKGSLTGLEFCNAVEKGLQQSSVNAEIIKLPLADGGDGTIEVVNYYLKGKEVSTTVNNPFFKKISATYLYAEKSQTAFIEMAEASGLKLLKDSEFNCVNSTTYGTGELILDALNKGAKYIILGIGGSATNDCGIGMANALGYRFLDTFDNDIFPISENLSKIVKIDDSQVNPKLKAVSVKIACDVKNPLYGKQGAAYVYAKQKGATPKDIVLLDKGLQDFSKVIDNRFNIISQNIVGAGAAGGMGIGAVVFLNGELQSGIELIMELAQFNLKIKNADWIITGEGKLDNQTLSGKTIQGIFNASKSKNIKIAAFCGSLELNETELNSLGITYADAVVNWAKNLEDAFRNSSDYLVKMAVQFSKYLKK